MSYSVVQQPDNYSLLSGISDIIIDSTEDLTVEILVESDLILSENYNPDIDGRIYVIELDRLLDSYLHGDDFDADTHSELLKLVTVKVNNTVLCTFNVLKFTAETSISAFSFVSGSIFMHLLKQKKITTPTAKEYLTVSFTDTLHSVKVFVTYFDVSDYVNSAEVDLFATDETGIRTIDASFLTVAALFPLINADSIVAYRIKLESEISVFTVDRNAYLLPVEYRFKNSFDVPETVITRGNIFRKGVTTFDSSMIRRVEGKFNVVRDDTFEVSSGKVFSLNDYDRFREMFNSEDVEINFQGKWRKIVITEENMNVALRIGNLQPFTFTFKFADKRDHNSITGESFVRWILEHGKWEDDKMWLDPEHWIDQPI
jgi:hypothetical protein